MAIGLGGVFRLNGTNSWLECVKSTFTGNEAAYGAVVSLGQNHSVRLVSNKIVSNLAFGGSLMHLGNDTANATQQVDMSQLFLKSNEATVGNFLFFDVPTPWVPAWARSNKLFGNVATAGPYTFTTLPTWYNVTAPAASKSSAILDLRCGWQLARACV